MAARISQVPSTELQHRYDLLKQCATKCLSNVLTNHTCQGKKTIEKSTCQARDMTEEETYILMSTDQKCCFSTAGVLLLHCRLLLLKVLQKMRSWCSTRHTDSRTRYQPAGPCTAETVGSLCKHTSWPHCHQTLHQQKSLVAL